MDMRFNNALLIHNPNAGTGGNTRRRLIDEARQFLSENGILSELAETVAKVRSALNRATRKAGRNVATATDADFLYVWNAK